MCFSFRKINKIINFRENMPIDTDNIICIICNSYDATYNMNCEHTICGICAYKIKEYHKEYDCIFCKNKMMK